MKACSGFTRFVCLLCLFLLSGMPRAETADKEFVSRVAEVAGVKLYHTTGGYGTPLILLHGYAETSRMCPDRVRACCGF